MGSGFTRLTREEVKEAFIRLLKEKGEVSRDILITLGRLLGGYSKKEVNSIIKELLETGMIYVTRRETIYKLT